MEYLLHPFFSSCPKNFSARLILRGFPIFIFFTSSYPKKFLSLSEKQGIKKPCQISNIISFLVEHDVRKVYFAANSVL